jgi:hypothetical protein
MFSLNLIFNQKSNQAGSITGRHPNRFNPEQKEEQATVARLSGEFYIRFCPKRLKDGNPSHHYAARLDSLAILCQALKMTVRLRNYSTRVDGL